METNQTPEGAGAAPSVIPADLDIPADVRAFAELHWKGRPLRKPLNVRVGADPFDFSKRAPGPRVHLRCHLSERRFSVPVGTPPPALTFELPDKGSEADDFSYTIHPDALKGGLEKLRQAIREGIENRMAEIEEAVIDLFELQAMLQQEIHFDLSGFWPGAEDHGYGEG